MIPTSTDLVRKDSIEELCGHRTRALELYALAHSTLIAAMEAHRKACIGNSHINTREITEMLRYPESRDASRLAQIIRAEVDRDMWRGFIVNTPLGSLMDVEEKRKFEDSLKQVPPECTPDTVFATMQRLAGDAGAIFRRGMANAFSRLSREYKSHDGFKIGDRVVMHNLVTGNGTWRYLNHYTEGYLADVDRCFHVLDGKTQPEYQTGACAALRSAIQKPGPCQLETDYFAFKWFGNGNAHIRFRRADLVEKANKLLAQHFGETLGQGYAARHAA